MSASSRLNKIDRVSVTSQIVDSVRAAILGGDITPGESLKELDLATQLDVSRGSVREALIKLEAEGLIEARVGAGRFVIQLSTQDVSEIYDLRLILEEEVIRLATEQVTRDGLEQLGELADQMIEAGRRDDVRTILTVNPVFHSLIWKFSGNGRLTDLLERHYNQVSLYLAASMHLQTHADRMQTVMEHRQMVDAMAAGDEKLAMQVMERHLTEAERLLRLFMTFEIDAGSTTVSSPGSH